jgi:hypothetical protein
VEYTINLENVEEETSEGHYRASVIYRFAISSGSATTHADIVLTEAGIDIIEKKGKDPKTAARIALERLLKAGRDPFERRIFIRIPFGHAEHFARFGNYESLPTLTD